MLIASCFREKQACLSADGIVHSVHLSPGRAQKHYINIFLGQKLAISLTLVVTIRVTSFMS